MFHNKRHENDVIKRSADVFIISFEQISHFVLEFRLLNLNK